MNIILNSTYSNIRSIRIIALNEFQSVVGHPVVIIISCIMFALAILNGIGSSAHLLPMFEESMKGTDVFITVGLGQILWDSALLSTATSIFIGVMSIIKERNNKSMDVLLTKPLYRRDVILGKFIGLNAFIMILITVNILVCTLLTALTFRLPLSLTEFLIRTTTYILALYLECSLAIVLSMLVGIICKEYLVAITVAITYLYLDWFSILVTQLGRFSFISPFNYLFYDIFMIDKKINLLDTSQSYLLWLNNSLPYIVLMVFAVILMLLVNCLVFSQMDRIKG